MKCAVGKCMQNDRKKSTVSFYSFPKNKEQRNLWVQFCNRPNAIKIKRERICSLHFNQEDFKRNLKYEMGFSNRATLKLKPGAVPTIEVSDIPKKEETLPLDENAKNTSNDTNEES